METQTSVGGGVLIRDLESKISLLERSNFDLKMQIYYLNEKLTANGTTTGGEPAVNSNSNIQQDTTGLNKCLAERDSALETVAALKEANRALSKKVTDAELELAQLRRRGSVNSTSGSGEYVLVEENRQRERSAMQAIAEHDASVILQLEDAVKTLQAQHNRDMVLVSNCTEKISGMIEELDKKEVVILKQTDKIASLQEQLDSASARVKQQDLLLLHKSASILDQPSNGSSARDQLGSRSAADTPHGAATPGFGATAAPSTSGGMSSREFIDLGVQRAWDELSKLRAQKHSMTEELEKRAMVIKTQEEALKRVKSTVEEISMLEAEEIAKLEQQLEAALNDNEVLRKKCRDLDMSSKVKMAKTQELEIRIVEMETLQDEMITIISDKEELLQQAAATPHVRVNSQNSSQRGALGLAAAAEFRVREAELINVLEGLILRIQQLEGKSRL